MAGVVCDWEEYNEAVLCRHAIVHTQHSGTT